MTGFCGGGDSDDDGFDSFRHKIARLTREREALWQAYENGIREGELRYLRPKELQVRSRTVAPPVTLEPDDDGE